MVDEITWQVLQAKHRGWTCHCGPVQWLQAMSSVECCSCQGPLNGRGWGVLPQGVHVTGTARATLAAWQANNN